MHHKFIFRAKVFFSKALSCSVRAVSYSRLNPLIIHTSAKLIPVLINSLLQVPAIDENIIIYPAIVQNAKVHPFVDYWFSNLAVCAASAIVNFRIANLPA